MPVDERLRDTVLEAVSLATDGRSVAVQQTPDRVFMQAGEHAIVISTGELPGLTPDDVEILVLVCDAYLSLADAMRSLPGTIELGIEARVSIRAAREKLRARL